MQRRLQSYALYAKVGGSYVFSLSVCVSVCLQDITKCCQRILIRIQEFFKGILSLRDKGLFLRILLVTQKSYRGILMIFLTDGITY